MVYFSSLKMEILTENSILFTRIIHEYLNDFHQFEHSSKQFPVKTQSWAVCKNALNEVQFSISDNNMLNCHKKEKFYLTYLNYKSSLHITKQRRPSVSVYLCTYNLCPWAAEWHWTWSGHTPGSPPPASCGFSCDSKHWLWWSL